MAVVTATEKGSRQHVVEYLYTQENSVNTEDGFIKEKNQTNKDQPNAKLPEKSSLIFLS